MSNRAERPLVVDVHPLALAIALRSELGVDPSDLVPVWMARDIEVTAPHLKGVDVDALTAWIIAGAELYSGQPPSLAEAIQRARITTVAVAMRQTDGNITWVADILDSSRRTVREVLQQGGLYPWVPRPKRRPTLLRDASPKVRQDELLGPFEPPPPGEPPPVVEDGTKGTVTFKTEWIECFGPAWLIRGDRQERLFGGRWVHQSDVEEYARKHGHEY